MILHNLSKKKDTLSLIEYNKKNYSQHNLSKHNTSHELMNNVQLSQKTSKNGNNYMIMNVFVSHNSPHNYNISQTLTPIHPLKDAKPNNYTKTYSITYSLMHPSLIWQKQKNPVIYISLFQTDSPSYGTQNTSPEMYQQKISIKFIEIQTLILIFMQPFYVHTPAVSPVKNTSLLISHLI